MNAREIENRQERWRLLGILNEKMSKRIERKDIATYYDMVAYCQQQKEQDGFCWHCSACSGASYANSAQAERACPDGMTAFQGGCGLFFVRMEE
ncbi:hypothetical protein AAY81_05085 [Denitrobacterium detoxificans]|uniref:Uncharacterized protein n=1 Tax=Denitrobacterium detoxificans TaxID=79604 RepID=A0A172RXZ9_9ACTN|nr:hypothetical protein [Denitrobacterium detoxificans]ANE22601.1 hypothetical protein AAY81_05085 [Denitrobacterium detoxificans]SEO92163.1 hypothetical protein SAMN02910314_01640 [Denitrobacterium detoxificans]